METLKGEAIYLTENETDEDAAADHHRFIDEIYNETRLHSAFG